MDSSLSASDESTPRYLVGPRPSGGFYVVETHGLGGGIFRDLSAALRYAERDVRRPGPVTLVDAAA